MFVGLSFQIWSIGLPLYKCVENIPLSLVRSFLFIFPLALLINSLGERSPILYDSYTPASIIHEVNSHIHSMLLILRYFPLCLYPHEIPWRHFE